MIRRKKYVKLSEEKYIREKFSYAVDIIYLTDYPSTHLEFGISDFGFVSLRVYDASGKEVAVLINENLSPGIYETLFDGSNYPSGVYFYKLESLGISAVKKMTLIK